MTLTTENGSKNRTWLRNRILNGTIEVLEQNEKRQNESHLYFPITKENALRLLPNMCLFASTGNEIIGAYGTSFYYKFKILN